MSSTTSSDRLTLLSYATFNHHIHIHGHSWRQHQWKQTETMIALASLALQSAKKLFQSWRSRTMRWYWWRFGDFTVFFWDISLDSET